MLALTLTPKGLVVMKRTSLRSLTLAVAVGWVGPEVFTASGQTSNTGTVTVTVLDQAGATVPSADLQLKDLGTNDVRKALTQTNGVYSFPNLPFGQYELTVSKTGFQT